MTCLCFVFRMGECFSLRRGGALAPPILSPTMSKDPNLDAIRRFSVFDVAIHAGTDCAVQSQVQWAALKCDGTGAFYFVLSVVKLVQRGS